MNQTSEASAVEVSHLHLLFKMFLSQGVMGNIAVIVGIKIRQVCDNFRYVIISPKYNC